MVNNSTALDAVFAALADPTRRRIVERLTRRAMTAGEIAAGFSMSQPAISKHLKVLERSGLLLREIDGRVHHCRLDPKAMERAARWLQTQQRFWNGAFERLDRYFAEHPERKKP